MVAIVVILDRFLFVLLFRFKIELWKWENKSSSSLGESERASER